LRRKHIRTDIFSDTLYSAIFPLEENLAAVFLSALQQFVCLKPASAEEAD
jgi:hypothetical protein